jgi:excisionase family DNA binding protein
MSTAQGSFEPLINAGAAAQILCLHPKTLMRMARENRIPAFHYGRYWMFRPSMIDAWLTTQLQSTVANPSA